MSELDAFFASVQKQCLPGVWSKGVAMSRDNPVIEDSRSDDEVVLRILLAGRPVSPKVTLWPSEDDWFCDCGGRNEICEHVAAAVVALKAGRTKKPEAAATAAQPGASSASASTGGVTRIAYRFKRDGAGSLTFDRFLLRGSGEERLTDSLVAIAGGISSGRVSAPQLAATREDFAVDLAVGGARGGKLEPSTMHKVLAALDGVSAPVTLDGETVRTSRKSLNALRAEVTDAPGGGWRARVVQDAAVDEIFSNGVARSGALLRPLNLPRLSAAEQELFSAEGRAFPRDRGAWLVTELLPSLEEKMPVDTLRARLPRVVDAAPRVLLKLDTLPGETLTVMPVILYGAPPVAEVVGDSLRLLRADTVPRRDLAAEKGCMLRLQNELNLRPGQLTKFSGQQAVEFKQSLKGWETAGAGDRKFEVTGELQPSLVYNDGGGFQVEFTGADPDRVLRAWRNGEDYVPLLGGGWAKLPRDWLEKYGQQISQLLAARGTGGALPAHRQIELAQLCEEASLPCPEGLKRLRDLLEKHEGIPEAELPADLRAELRDYQKRGVSWLGFLGQAGMGAMLADDMGLGKTLQALCAVRGRTLVVCPTSVLHGWSSQLRQFRPGLAHALYYGGGRKLDPAAPVTLTTYALLRIDAEKLGAVDWDTVVLDEAQTIRNPDSQVARAAHALRAKSRITLTGTPVENRLDDLWSQFQFLNPGLLGTRQDFQESFSSPISRGDSKAAQRLRARIKPFILRRLKREVAPELPPRTEVVLECELGESERKLYDSVYASTRAEVLRQLEEGGSVMGALEALLRLRQAACHPALVPGSEVAAGGTSAKLDLLMETLEESLSEGHRSLVFSQWTSFLDLMEPELRERGVEFLRIDGSTQNRQDIVEKFQSPSGPPVLLMSLKAGGVGLTLTAADQVFLMDPWWNPAAEEQAADRAHRIGQVNPVLVQRLVSRNTVEERILALQERKRELARAALDGGDAGAGLTREDLLELLR